MRKMSPALRRECDADPVYHVCARNRLLRDHICRPRPLDQKLIEWEHAIIYAGKQINEKWAIVPLCWQVHSGPEMIKEINVWIALNQASEDDLRRYSKAVDLIRERDRLNKIYGS